MSNENSERDTHFQGFANLLYPDLAKLFVAMYSFRATGEEEKANMVEVVIKDVLARRGYDLAAHVIWECPISDYEFDMRNVPDLTEWPDTSS